MEAISEAMEELVLAVRELALSASSVKVTVDESHGLLRKIGAGEPHVDGALQKMRSDNATPRQQLGRVALNPILELDPSTLQARAMPAVWEGGVSAAVEFGSSPAIGGLEVVASSLRSVDPATETSKRDALGCQQWSTRSAHPCEAPSVNDLDANCVDDSSDLSTAVPTKCSMLCSITDKDDVQAEAMSMKPSIPSTTLPAPAGLLMFPFVQQSDALLPYNLATMASPCKDNNIDIDAVYGADDASQPVREQVEAVLSTASTLLEVKATQLLKAFLVLDLGWLVPAKCSAECPDVTDPVQLYKIVSHEKAEFEILAVANVVCVDTGDHRQPPWPPPQSCTIRFSCWGIYSSSQTELKPWHGETQYRFTGVIHPWQPLCKNLSLHELPDILGQVASFDLHQRSSNGLRGMVGTPRSRMLLLHGNDLSPLAMDQSKVSMKWCCSDLLLRVTNQLGSEYEVTIIPMQMIERSSELNLLLSSSAPCFLIRNYRDGGALATYLNLDADRQPYGFGSVTMLSLAVLQDLFPSFILPTEAILEHIHGQVLCHWGRSMQAHLMFDEVRPCNRSSFSSVSIGMTTICLVFVHWAPSSHGGFSSGSAVVQSWRHWYSANNHVQSMLSFSINLHRHRGVPNQLIREGVLSEVAQREQRGTLINSDGSFAHCLFTWPLYWEHLGRHFRFNYHPIAYIYHESELVAMSLVGTTRARILGRNADHCLLQKEALIQTTACKALSWEYATCGRLDYLRRMLLMIRLWCMISLPVHTPWDPGEQLQQTTQDDSPFQPVPSDLPDSLAIWKEEAQLHAFVSRAPAWGQAGVEEGGNVTTWHTPTKHQAGHSASSPLNSRATPRARDGRTEH